MGRFTQTIICETPTRCGDFVILKMIIAMDIVIKREIKINLAETCL